MLERIFEKTDIKDILPIIIATIAIVGFWRGFWGLMDIYLFPQNKILSLTSSIILGLIIVISIAFYKREKPKKKRKKRHKK